MSPLETISTHRLLPVIVIDDAAHAGPLAGALLAGGLPVAEVTMRTPAAEASIRTMANNTEMIVGAGTVLTIDLCKRAIDAGAQFVVTPGFNPKVVKYCVENSIPITPGVSTCTEIELALDLGVTTVKFFPAESIGGAKALKAICAPYGHVKFVPTGGITQATMRDYLAIKQVVAVGGSWMVAKELLNAGRFDEVSRLTLSAVSAVRQG
ncbi:MAG TPA: bifunctional 4-hydroxy-2-oxoglutarate aldolase/2-dehydro-3-deoxy-phosphogluconate aldolase [Tepidisphaeraceae bacterium]|nr:bifunctional 4-hydroxy-2-oxoglutarate aldolase/2-dehydro-3-deoxy-phosphogluconate aldolase [Tepidisphaeraceae bacterium]